MKTYCQDCMIEQLNIFCITKAFKNPIKSCFLNDKYPFSVQTRPTKTKENTFLIKNPVSITVLYRFSV